MLTYLLQSSTCLIILYCIYHFILAEMTFFKYNRAYLLLSLLASLMIPILAPLLVLPEESVPVLHWSHLAGDITYVVGDNEVSVFDWKGLIGNVLWVIYFVGVVVVLLKMVYGLSKIFRYHRQGQKEDFNGYRIITTEAVHLPFSFFNSIYISRHVPLQDHIHTILEHEEIHIRQWHTLDVLMAEMVHAFFWFNPVMIFYKRALRQAHEYLADDLICRKNSVSSYTELLLSKSQSGLELALTNQFFHSQIKKRIQMMTTNKTNQSAAWKYALVLPILIGLVFIFSCKESQVTDITTAEPKTETTPKSSPEIYTEAEMENVFKVVEEMPRFPGCENIKDMRERKTCADKKMFEYIYNNLNYPTEAKEAGVEGQCVIQFIVAIDGSIENIKVVRDIGGGCGEATRNVVEKMNNLPSKWISGKQSGKPVKVMYTLPVKFKLEDDGIGMIQNRDNLQSISELASTNFEYQKQGELLLEKPKKFDNLIKGQFELLKTSQAKNIDVDKVALIKGLDVDFLSVNNEQEVLNLGKGDIEVTGNGFTLVEDVDYVIDYPKGNLRIINSFILDGNQQLNVRFKN